MAVPIHLPAQDIQPKGLEELLNQHSISVAFAVSSLVLFILRPLGLLLGTILGFTFSYALDPLPNLKLEGPPICVSNTVLMVIGALATLLSYTPAGMGGGFVFRTIPLLSCFSAGDTIYRAYKSL